MMSVKWLQTISYTPNELQMKKKSTSWRRLDEGQHPSFTPAAETDRIVLIEWLNAAVGTASYRRVQKLLTGINRATAARDAALRDHIYIHVHRPGDLKDLTLIEKRRRRGEIDKLLGPISSALRGYVFHPRLLFMMAGRQSWWLDIVGDAVSGDYKYTREDGRRIYEADAVFGILRLASYGLLERVRQCLTCQEWLYAQPSHKKFCAKACQLNYFSSMPRQKNKRAAYMRDYRLAQKERIEREPTLTPRRKS
jgi:hypothetical protein